MIQKGPADQPRTANGLQDRHRSPRTGGVKPGNEDVTIIDDRSEDETQDREEMVSRKERKVAKTIAPFVLMALILATLATTFLTRRWEFLLALLVFVPDLFLISAPLWLGASKKVAQNETERERDDTNPGPR